MCIHFLKTVNEFQLAVSMSVILPEGACPLKIKGSFKLPFCVLRVEIGKKGKRKQKKPKLRQQHHDRRQMIILTN